MAQEPHNVNFGLIKYQLIVNKLKFSRYEGTVLATLPLKSRCLSKNDINTKRHQDKFDKV